MSQTETAQLEQCMEHLAYILNKLGVKEATFSQGTVAMQQDGLPINQQMMNNFCHHISSIYREGITEEEEDLDPDFYFSV
ncbi:MAG: hypothetical protein EOP49_09800 [Sphingobacteriales bacterium]|nr:MAG: hypothetical protein EOP49_09800 [Sphingobacteriales bacterium]